MLGRTESITYSHVPILVRLVHPDAKLPQQSAGDIGFDVSCIETMELSPQRVTRIRTGIQLASAIEPLFVEKRIVATPFLKIEGRSGLASRGVFPVGGIVDPSFRGEIEVALFNSHPMTSFVIEKGDRIAQLVVYFAMANVGSTSVQFLQTDKSNETPRGDKGFGSSGA